MQLIDIFVHALVLAAGGVIGWHSAWTQYGRKLDALRAASDARQAALDRLEAEIMANGRQIQAYRERLSVEGAAG